MSPHGTLSDLLDSPVCAYQVKDACVDASGHRVMLPRVSLEVVTPHLGGFLASLFGIMSSPGYPENEYLMRCVTRLVFFGGASIVPHAPTILTETTRLLEAVRS